MDAPSLPEEFTDLPGIDLPPIWSALHVMKVGCLDRGNGGGGAVWKGHRGETVIGRSEGWSSKNVT